MTSLTHPGAMSSVAPPTPSAPSAPASPRWVVLSGIRWHTYEMLLADFEEQPGWRLTYDHGRLQIMSPLPEHERYSRLLGQLFRALAGEARIRYGCFGSSTYRREDLQRGLEPDDCFYMANLPRVLDRRRIDLTRDPAPDLALEIDITHDSLDRLSIYAALGVPEVWRFDGDVLHCHCLTPAGAYEQREHSLAFPRLCVADLVPFLQQLFTTDEGSLIQSFQEWLRRGPLSAAR